MSTPFAIDQAIAAPADAVMEALSDPGFWPLLGELETVDPPEVVEAVADGALVRLRIRYRLAAELPRMARRFVDPDDLRWIDETEIDVAGRSARFRILPERYESLLEGSGAWTVEADGSGSTQRYRGSVSVRLPMVGASVERGIVNGLTELLEGAAGLVERRHAGA